MNESFKIHEIEYKRNYDIFRKKYLFKISREVSKLK